MSLRCKATYEGDLHLGTVNTNRAVSYAEHWEAAQKASELDKLDDFDRLKLGAAEYAKKDDTYGIEQTNIHADGSVILDYQKAAAHKFLRDFRGFGLLAEEVGRGKTYEAGVILSELGVRGHLKSLLVITPGNLPYWKETMEKKFSLGEGVMREIGDNIGKEVFVRSEDGYLRPDSPWLVRMDDFVKWSAGKLNNVCFDAIVVDEAHNLYKKEERNRDRYQYQGAMQNLSRLMETKRNAGKPYCILLSATPHAGNLADMTDLWCFIRCKGGKPEDWQEKPVHSEEYIKEKAYYEQFICRSADTVSEFIAAGTEMEIEERYGKEFASFCKKLPKSKAKLARSKSGLRQLRDEFLNASENYDKKCTVTEAVRKAYHDRLMGMIMIRQPRPESERGRKAYNYYFFPVNKFRPKKVNVDVVVGNETKTFSLNTGDFYAPNAVKYGSDEFSLATVANKLAREVMPQEIEDEGAFAAFNAYRFRDETGEKSFFEDRSIFKKGGTEEYYRQQWHESVNSNILNFYRITQYSSTDGVFYEKLAELIRIAREKSDKKIAVFFDYKSEYGEQGAEWERIISACETRDVADVTSRFLYAPQNSDADEIKKEFLKKEHAILLAGNEKLSESFNLQEANCHIILNFSVCPDPQAMDQRIGRIDRLGQDKDVEIISFAAMNELEGYVLAYYNRIGLMHSCSSDATIIAGSNSEKMKVVRCKNCGRIKLCPSVFITGDESELTCDGSNCNNERMVLLKNTTDFKCDVCGLKFSRVKSDSAIHSYSYLCNATNKKKGKMLQPDLAKNEYSCNKRCAIANCKKFAQIKDSECEAIRLIRQNNRFYDLRQVCEKCRAIKKNFANCKEECTMLTGIDACHTCLNAGCSPKPYTLTFDEQLTAECPSVSCGKNGRQKGRLRPVETSTFARFVTETYAFDSDDSDSFTVSLLNEADKTANVKDVLDRR